MSRLSSFWRNLLHRDRVERDLDDELRAIFEMLVDEKIRAGMGPEQARRAATLELGRVDALKEQVREVKAGAVVDSFLQDVRYAMRTIRRAPGVAGIAVGSAALGIGSCAVIFAILNFARLQPLPVDEPSRLMSVSEQDLRTGVAGGDLSYPDLRDLRPVRAFEGVAGHFSLLTASIGAHGDPQRHWGALVTANYFAVVRPRFVVGRGFDVSRDDIPGEPPVVVLSHHLWQTRFGGDRSIVGETVPINSRPVTVIGVTDAGFRGTEVGIVSEFWIPFSMIDEFESRRGPAAENRPGLASENRRRHWLWAVARLRPGATVQDARAELDLIAQDLNARFGPGNESRGFHIEQAGQINPGLRRIASTFFSLSLGATVLILLTACANVANLLLGRAAARRREIAVRMALGGSRVRLLRQLLTESLVLALAGGLGGWIIAAYGTGLVGLVRIPLGWPLDLSISLDYRVLLFCIALSIVTGVAFGLVPALRATRLDLVTDLKADARGSAGADRLGLRHALVVAQVTICTVLLLCMGLFLRSLLATRGMDCGLKNRNLLLLAFDPSLDRRKDPEARQLLREILNQADAVPGVESATLTTSVPLTLVMNNSNFRAEEKAADPAWPRTRADIYSVGPRFFRTLGISVQAGTDFRFDQAGTERIAIVNEAFARAAFPDQSPIGRRIVGDGKRLQIVGVVATAKSRTIDEAPRPSIYLPILSEYSGAQSLAGVTLVVETRDAAGTYAGPMREAIRRAAPTLAVFDVRTMQSHLGDALIVPRLAGMLSAVAGGVALVLATIGVYGVISFAVARRRRELGIRLAIGARPREILVMILRQGAILASTGIVLGFLVAVAVTRFAASLLYGVSPTDAITFVAVPPVLTAVALLACALPARDAARLDPVEVLRSE